MLYLKLFEEFNSEVKTINDLPSFPEYFYHGTNQDFNKFDIKYVGSNFESSILGIYLTQYLQPPPYGASALEFAEQAVKKTGGSPIIYKCKVNFSNPLIIDSKGFYNSNAKADAHRLKLKHNLEEGNHDGIVIYNSEGYKLPDYITDDDLIKTHRSIDPKNLDYLIITSNPDNIEIIEKLRPKK